MTTKLSITIIARMQRAHLGIRGFGRQSPSPLRVFTLKAMLEELRRS